MDLHAGSARRISLAACDSFVVGTTSIFRVSSVGNFRIGDLDTFLDRGAEVSYPPKFNGKNLCQVPVRWI
ncbi:MAG: hypothetical protein CBC13_03190 [Planctomycetia bacterium TMED53]|nr:MAG: hypothetical protein CBC13_03190 [Planctomycetia bacterium TMED53]